MWVCSKKKNGSASSFQVNTLKHGVLVTSSWRATAPSLVTKRSLRFLVTTASHRSTTSLSQVSFPSGCRIFVNARLNSWVRVCPQFFSFFLVFFSAHVLFMARRMSADEDRATQTQHICHPLPAVDLRYRAHFPRRQQRGEVRHPFKSRLSHLRSLLDNTSN